MSNSKVKVTRLKIMVPNTGLASRNTHVKYQSSLSHCSKFINKVKFPTDLQNDRQDKNNTPTDLQSQGIQKPEVDGPHCSP